MRSIASRVGTGLLAAVAAFSGMTGAATADDDPKARGAAFGALSSVPYVTITSSGPIGSIHLGNELSCQVNIAPVVPATAVGSVCVTGVNTKYGLPDQANGVAEYPCAAKSGPYSTPP